MSVSLFSFLMSVLFSIVFILAIHTLRKRPFFLKSFGVHTILIMYGLCLFRMIFVIELPFAVPVGLRGTFSQVYDNVRQFQVPVGNASTEFLDLLYFVWIAVAGALFIRFILRDYTVRKKLAPYHRNRNYAAERALAKVKAVSAREIPVGVCVCPGIDTPMGLGLFQRWIYLPDEEYTKDELLCIMSHEYMHFYNRDRIVKLLTLLFCYVFWWNPAVYLLKKDVEQILEIKCDITVTQDFKKKECLEYLFTIMRVLKGEQQPAKGIGSPLMATKLVSRTEYDDIKERFDLITRASKKIGVQYQVAFIGLAVLVTVLSCVFVFQSAFDPPVEEIYTDETTVEWDSKELYILQHQDMTYSIVLENGEMHPISDPVLQIYIEAGTTIRKE